MLEYKKNERRAALIEILYKSKNAVVIYKPAGVPSQSDPSGDPDAMTLTSSVLHAQGEGGELWLVHRIDRVVGGILIFARNKRTAAILSEIVKDRTVTKEYYAVVDGESEGGVLENFIFRDSRLGKAFIVDRERGGVKKARLSYKKLAERATEKGVKTLVFVTLDTRRFHQIRAQMSHIKTPITGDGKYGSRDKDVSGIALFASHLELSVGGEHINVSRLPDLSAYPWNLFNKEDYEA
jgi:23S rRNA pseudouridine1911/1915/1917 synthase